MLKHWLMTAAGLCVATVLMGAQERVDAAAVSPARAVAQQAPRPAQPPSTPREGPPPAAPRPEQPQPPSERSEPPGQPVNIKLDITITDQAGPGDPVRKEVTMTVADGQNANIRTSGRQRVTGGGDFPVSINVDAQPVLMRDGSIRLRLALEYLPRPNAGQPQAEVQTSQMSALNERISVILQNGKPLVISQAADPGSDRRITVELRAAVLK
jgi:hypothetical protein